MISNIQKLQSIDPIYFPERKSVTAAETSSPPHLTYFSGKRGELWRKLVDRGVLDAYGNLTPQYKSFILPELRSEELQIIRNIFAEVFLLDIGPSFGTPAITMEEVINVFLFEMPKIVKCHVNMPKLIGSYVIHFLFHQTDYARRVFENLGIPDLYDAELFKLPILHPADIDLRMHVEKQSTPAWILKKSLLEMRDFVIEWLIDRFNPPPEKREQVRDLFLNSAFKDLCTVSGLNAMQNIELEKTPIDWVFYFWLARECLFSTDDLFFPILSIFDKRLEGQTFHPESFIEPPLTCFFHNLLGITRAINPATIDETGWFRFISRVVKGNSSAQLSEKNSPQLEALLYEKMYATWISEDPCGIGTFNELFIKYLTKHYPQDAEGRLFFVLNACLFLHKRLNPEEIALILNTHLSPLTFEKGSLASQLQHLLVEKRVPIAVVGDCLQLGAFLIHTRKSGSIATVEVGTEDFKKPVFQLMCGGKHVQLSCEPHLALQRLEQYQQKNPQAFKEMEPALSALFLTLCPSTDTHYKINEQVASNLISLEPLKEATRASLQNSSPLLNYFGYLFQLGLQPAPDETLRFAMERVTLGILELFGRTPALIQQLEVILGKESIPQFSSQELEKRWIATLFSSKRGSQEVAYQLWKQKNDREPDPLFTFDLIRKLCLDQPEYAVRLLLNFKATSEDLSAIVECYHKLATLETHTLQHDALVNLMNKTLLTLIKEEKSCEVIGTLLLNSPILEKASDQLLVEKLVITVTKEAKAQGKRKPKEKIGKLLVAALYAKYPRSLKEIDPVSTLPALLNHLKAPKQNIALLSLKQAYEYASFVFAQIILQEPSDSSKDKYWAMRAECTMNYLSSLLSTKEAQAVEEAKTTLTLLLKDHKNYPNDFWLKWAQMINFLATPSTLDLLDETLDLITFYPIAEIQTEKLFLLLAASLTEQRALRGVQIWKYYFRHHNLRMTPECWRQLNLFINRLLTPLKSSYENLLGLTFEQICLNSQKFLSICGSTFVNQQTELQLRYLSQVSSLEKAIYAYNSLPFIFGDIHNIVHSTEESNRLIGLMSDAVVHLSQLEGSKFANVASLYWHHLSTLASKGKKAKEKCFTYKKQFIEALLNGVNPNASDQTRNKLLLTSATSFITDMSKDGFLSNHKAEIETLRLFCESFSTHFKV